MTIFDCFDFIVNNTKVQNYLSFIANIAAVIGIYVSLYQIIKGRKELKQSREKRNKEEIRKNQEIQVFLNEKDNKRKICLPNTIRRGDLTRAEVLGRLGMIPIKKSNDQKNTGLPRFNLNQLVTKESISNIDSLFVSSEGTVLIINCETEEMEQFDIKEMEKLGFDMWGFN